MSKVQIFRRLSERWSVSEEFLKDVYFIMCNDVRFMSLRNEGGIQYKKMENHLKRNYRIVSIKERQLRYLVMVVKNCVRR